MRAINVAGKGTRGPCRGASCGSGPSGFTCRCVHTGDTAGPAPDHSHKGPRGPPLSMQRVEGQQCWRLQLCGCVSAEPRLLVQAAESTGGGVGVCSGDRGGRRGHRASVRAAEWAGTLWHSSLGENGCWMWGLDRKLFLTCAPWLAFAVPSWLWVRGLSVSL